ncbi:amino acid adenylation domain-containing protein [Embleya sp. MST-111070]|uniref:non-ribosomal peptide synthetase n=1 Tax=Embleya sp. MST-111070 TaxID=3398231 RepID=UPI003F73AFB0
MRLRDPVPSGEEIRRRLDRAGRRWGAPDRLPLAEVNVPVPREAPGARARVRREALRPVRQGPFPLRVVLVRHADATADLVLVAARGRFSLAALHEVADVVVSDAEPGEALPPPTNASTSSGRWPRVDWGLGDPRRAGTIGSRQLALPAGAGGGDAVRTAVARTLAGYGGVADPEIGDPDEVPAGPGGTLPPVGVVITPARVDRTYLPTLTPAFPMTVHGVEGADGSFEGWCRFDEGTIAPEVAEDFCASVVRLATGPAADPDAPLSSPPPLVDPAHVERILRLGGAGVPPGDTPRIDRLFETVARRHPDAVALVADDGELTYRQLDERADALAAGLRASGITAGGMVGICLDRNTHLVVAMLGVLKAGCAYVPMDAGYPPERLRYIVANAGLRVVLAGDIEAFPAEGDVLVRRPADVIAAADLATVHGPDDDHTAHDHDAPAYVIHTSGSTGRPKGVVVPHRNVTALLAATAADFSLGPDDVWTLFHSSAFDFSVWEIWGCLLTGGRLVIVSYWVARDTEEFHRLLVEQRVTVLNQTPSAFAQLARTDRRATDELAVRLLIFGGEPLDTAVLGPWFARHSHTRCRVVNMFGITETTVHVTAQTITPADVVAGSRSVGRALPGWSVSVRDEHGRVLPPGPAGEIHVGGAGVALGYLGRPDLTAQRFILDPVTGERLYRSGDKGRLRPDGRLDHLGRLDSQVKIRGHRIELDEIRSVLAADPEVGAAVVVVNQATPGDPATSRIDAYVVLTTGSDTRRVLDRAKRILPDYMTPTTLTEIPSIPLTDNGKPDLARLPAPTVGTPDHRPDPVASDPLPTAEPDGLAAAVLDIWSRCLRTRVTREDNFFEMGGNSLLVVQVLTSMRERRLPRVSTRDFYRNSNAGRFIALVEQRLEASRHDPDAIPHANPPEIPADAV